MDDSILFLFGTDCDLLPRKSYTMRADYERVVNAVAEATDLTKSQVLSKRKYQEVTDARWIVVYLLKEQGCYTPRIAEWMGMTTRNVNLILSAFAFRLSVEKQLRSNLESARKLLHQSE